MATAKQLKALRKKYKLGEYSDMSDAGLERARKARRRKYSKKTILKYYKKIGVPTFPARAYVRGKSRTPTLTKYKRKIRRVIRKAPGKVFRKLGTWQGFPSNPFRL